MKVMLDISMETNENILMLDRAEDLCDCVEKQMYYKWMRVAEIQSGGQI